MNITHTAYDTVEVVAPDGRLDHHGSEQLAQSLAQCDAGARPHLVLDLGRVGYISSAALRVVLKEVKRRHAIGGGVTLAALQQYTMDVIRISGLEGVLVIQPDVETAVRAFGSAGARPTADWSTAETMSGDWGHLAVQPGTDEPGFLDVAGDIKDVLASRVSASDVFSKRFAHKAFSIGLGGMGAALDDYYRLMGEMITIGGAMVWLPCDGHGVPDFLVPKQDSAAVLMRSGFNVSLAGGFNEYMVFTSARPEGATMAELYRVLFDQAKRRRPDFRGALGLAIRADMPAVFGAGVVKAPVIENRPSNGLPITDPSNFAEWFEFDAAPRHRDVTGLIAGCGIDLTVDHAAFAPEHFGRTFYVNPANRGSSDLTLHNHAVVFSPLPWGETGVTLESEIASVLENGDFVDMRHLLDASTIRRAVIGVIYVQDFRPDEDRTSGHA